MEEEQLQHGPPQLHGDTPAPLDGGVTCEHVAPVVLQAVKDAPIGQMQVQLHELGGKQQPVEHGKVERVEHGPSVTTKLPYVKWIGSQETSVIVTDDIESPQPDPAGLNVSVHASFVQFRSYFPKEFL